MRFFERTLKSQRSTNCYSKASYIVIYFRLGEKRGVAWTARAKDSEHGHTQ
jgi:hypothetical protein